MVPVDVGSYTIITKITLLIENSEVAWNGPKRELTREILAGYCDPLASVDPRTLACQRHRLLYVSGMMFTELSYYTWHLLEI